MKTFGEIQEESGTWRNLNFPGWTGRQQLFGVIEEVGEFAHAYLKRQQGIRGSEEHHLSNMKDAIGDIMIYFLGFMTAKGINAEVVWSYPVQRVPSDGDEALLSVSGQLGKVCRAVQLDFGSELSLSAYCSSFMHLVDSLSRQTTGLPSLDHTATAWAIVQERDWIAKPQDGGGHDHG